MSLNRTLSPTELQASYMLSRRVPALYLVVSCRTVCWHTLLPFSHAQFLMSQFLCLISSCLNSLMGGIRASVLNIKVSRIEHADRHDWNEMEDVDNIDLDIDLGTMQRKTATGWLLPHSFSPMQKH